MWKITIIIIMSSNKIFYFNFLLFEWWKRVCYHRISVQKDCNGCSFGAKVMQHAMIPDWCVLSLRVTSWPNFPTIDNIFICCIGKLLISIEELWVRNISIYISIEYKHIYNPHAQSYSNNNIKTLKLCSCGFNSQSLHWLVFHQI